MTTDSSPGPPPIRMTSQTSPITHTPDANVVRTRASASRRYAGIANGVSARGSLRRTATEPGSGSGGRSVTSSMVSLGSGASVTVIAGPSQSVEMD